MSDNELTEDVLFLACTRPAMWQGVPLEALVVNGMATSFLVILAKNPLYAVGGIAIHYVIRALVSRDYNMFSILRLYMETKARARNKDKWGGSSVSPLPLRPARNAREVRVNA